MSKRGWSVIVASILVALILVIMPLPLTVKPYRPDWLLLVLTYWTMALPHRISVGTAWLCGLLVDVLLGSTLGIHALAMTLCIFIVASNYLRIRNFSIWQQALIMGLLAAFYHLLQFWIERLLHGVFFTPGYLWPVVTTTLLWPWCYLLLRKLRRQFGVK